MIKKSLLDLLKEKSDNMFTISGVNGLLDLLDKFSHQIEEQEETIHELQSVLKFRTNENKELYKENNRLKEVIKIKDDARIELVEENKKLKKCLTIADNDLKQAQNEIKLLNNQIDRHINAVNDLTDIVEDLKNKNNMLCRNIAYLCEENTRLRHELNEEKNHDSNY